MPYKFKHGCPYPGCNKLTDKRYCEEHMKLLTKQYNEYTRLDEVKKKYNYKWKKIRDAYVAEHPLCEMCLKEGKYTPVEEVHHILPVSRGGTNDTSNLMSVCKSCHNKLHIALGDRK